VKFTDDAITTIANRITALGLQRCPICDGQTMHAAHRPVVMNIGGIPGSTTQDVGTNILYMALVRCDVCGHAMFFDAEKFYGSDEPMLEREAPKPD
jgi:hypothetical protein